MTKKILQREATVLRKIAQNVPLNKITSPEIQKILSEMKEALDSQDDGVAIAAPQIGYPLRIFVVSRKVEKIIKEETEGKFQDEKLESSTIPERSEGSKTYKALATTALATTDLIFINPVIKKISKERRVVEEGCLSVRYLYGKVSRARKVKIEAYDENGKKFERGGTGLLAQIFQHETDHLEGVLFTDKAKDLEEIPPPKPKLVKKDGNK